MARTKSPPSKYHRPQPSTYTLLGLSHIILLTRTLTSTSHALSSAISTLQALPLHQPIPLTIQSLTSHMSRQISSLHALGLSPHLFPRTAREQAHFWADDFAAELAGYQGRLEGLLQEREDAKWVLELFTKFDRGGEGTQLAVGRAEWADLVEEVMDDVLEERYHTAEELELGVDGNGNGSAEDAAGFRARTVETDGSAQGAHDLGQVEEITDDAINTLQLLAEGYTAWFFGLAQDATDACTGKGMELDWDSWQLVRAQWTISGLSSDECMRISMREAAAF
ncbi:hypothetical protein BZA05DRAFT_274887 [Tricharina praecox]|uniref:uncharacterized protein n=1 Tax=Tricharina praecox TaxID=43433 RepID=UPI0022210B82|nr:uncharacterized protein BZA05DRAFT_274887 [Tricharina praecox]KAI5853940.1 hypothetical protein BZA05DRAFT_274887 [Tricharina praecox]